MYKERCIYDSKEQKWWNEVKVNYAVFQLSPKSSKRMSWFALSIMQSLPILTSFCI